jgi:hypothetical protein
MTTAVKRSCVFCGSPADSREHVFAKRLCKRANVEHLPVISEFFAEGDGTVARPPHLLDGVKVRHVCTACNNGWMNDLEAWFEQHLGCLIEPSWPNLALPMIEALREERATLAHWLMKTAVMFNLATLQNDRVAFDPTVTGKIKDGILPPHCWVDLAYSRLSTVGGAISKGFRVVNGHAYNRNQVYSKGLGFRFTIQFNHLLLRIARIPEANVTYDFQHTDGAVPVRLYPEPWPDIPEKYQYEDLMQFEHAVVLTTSQNCKGNIP